MRYDTVLLDADDTLLDFHRSEREALTDTMRELGIEPTEEKISAYSRINASLWRALERGEIEKSVLLYRRFALFSEYLGLESDTRRDRSMAECYMQSLSTKGYLLDGALALCQALYGRARLYIVTNGVEFIQRGRYAVCGLSDYVDGVFISGVIGHEKPSLAYFTYVAEHIPNFCKERTLLVGDSLTSDMRGGVAFGLDTCWYNPKGLSPTEDLAGRITYTVKEHKEIEAIIRRDA